MTPTAVLYAGMALAALAALLALVLAVVYARNHRELRSPFTLGLLLFASFVVIHNVVLVYHLATMMGSPPGGEIFTLAETGLEVAALATLLYATLR